jgi:hypothetical protein
MEGERGIPMTSSLAKEGVSVVSAPTTLTICLQELLD